MADTYSMEIMTVIYTESQQRVENQIHPRGKPRELKIEARAEWALPGKER